MGVIRNSFKNEGALFMFKGWVPAYVISLSCLFVFTILTVIFLILSSWMRLQPTTILIFLTFEQLKRLVDYTRGDL